MPTWSQCSPCAFRPNVILHFENLAAEEALLRRQLIGGQRLVPTVRNQRKVKGVGAGFFYVLCCSRSWYVIFDSRTFGIGGILSMSCIISSAELFQVKDDELTAKYFSMLSQKDIDRLKQVYRKDFEMFGYTWP